MGILLDKDYQKDMSSQLTLKYPDPARKDETFQYQRTSALGYTIVALPVLFCTVPAYLSFRNLKSYQSLTKKWYYIPVFYQRKHWRQSYRILTGSLLHANWIHLGLNTFVTASFIGDTHTRLGDKGLAGLVIGSMVTIPLITSSFARLGYPVLTRLVTRAKWCHSTFGHRLPYMRGGHYRMPQCGSSGMVMSLFSFELISQRQAPYSYLSIPCEGRHALVATTGIELLILGYSCLRHAQPRIAVGTHLVGAVFGGFYYLVYTHSQSLVTVEPSIHMTHALPILLAKSAFLNS